MQINWFSKRVRVHSLHAYKYKCDLDPFRKKEPIFNARWSTTLPLRHNVKLRLFDHKMATMADVTMTRTDSFAV